MASSPQFTLHRVGTRPSHPAHSELWCQGAHKMNILKSASILIVALYLCGCGAGKLHENIPLVWKPTNDVYDINSATLTGMFDQKFRIEPFVDSRENRREIAKYIEDNRNMPVTTKDDVGIWCSDRFRSIARQFGLSVV